MDKKELKRKLKNPDFKEGYQLAEDMWRERLSAAVKREKVNTDEYREAVFNLFELYMDMKFPDGWR